MSELTSVRKQAKLGEVCDIRVGLSSRGELEPEQTTKLLVIQGVDIANTSLKRADLKTRSLQSDDANKYKIIEGDVIIPVISRTPKALIVTKELAGAVAMRSVIIIRPDLNLLSPQYVAAFLTSDKFAKLARTVSSTLKGDWRLSVTSLRDINFPMYSKAELDNFAALYSESQQLINRADDLQVLISSFFDITNSEFLQQKLIEYSVSARVAQLSIDVAIDINFQIKNFFHFPIAFPYRLLQTEFETTKIQRRLHQTSEGVAAYTAGLLLSSLGPIPKDLAQYVKRAFGGYGATFGNWFQIIQRSVPYLDETSSSFHRDMKYLLLRKDADAFLTLMEFLLKSRDDFHHGEELGGTDVEEAIINIHDNLSKALKQLSILTRHPLYLPVDFDSLRGKSNVTVTALKYIGDHPGMKKISVELGMPPKKNDLYIAIDDSQDWRCLYPFISIQYCKHCKFRETYYVDQWKIGSAAKLKSFERGHTVESVEIGTALADLLS